MARRRDRAGEDRPATTPWIANGALHADGRTRTRSAACARARRSRRRPGAADVGLGDGAIRVSAPLDQTIVWVYADPPGGEHHTGNCSVAALERRRRRGARLRTAHGGVYELGMREHDHGLPVHPFPDP